MEIISFGLMKFFQFSSVREMCYVNILIKRNNAY